LPPFGVSRVLKTFLKKKKKKAQIPRKNPFAARPKNPNPKFYEKTKKTPNPFTPNFSGFFFNSRINFFELGEKKKI